MGASFELVDLRIDKKDKKKGTASAVLKNLCADTVTNLHQIVDDMDLMRSKDRLNIHGDYLLLLDVEINAFSRNREHLAYLPASLRNKIRQFVTDCAIGRAELGTHLAMFSSQWALANEWQARGGGPVAQRAREDALKGSLTAAHKAVDRLVHYVSHSSDLVKEINAA